MQNDTYVVNFSPPKKYHIARLTNLGEKPLNISLLGFPEQFFYTNLSHEPSLINILTISGIKVNDSEEY